MDARCDLFHRKKQWTNDDTGLAFCRRCNNHGHTPNYVDEEIKAKMGINIEILAEWWCNTNRFEPPFPSKHKWSRDEIHGAWMVLDAIVPQTEWRKVWNKDRKKK